MVAAGPPTQVNPAPSAALWTTPEQRVAAVDSLLSVADQIDPAGADLRYRRARFAALLSDRLGLSADDRLDAIGAAQLSDLFDLLEPGTHHGFDPAGALATASLVASNPALRSVAAVIATRFERYDFSGGPAGLGGDKLRLVSQVLTATDIAVGSGNDATHHSGADTTRQNLQAAAGTDLDPLVVRAARATCETIENGPEHLLDSNRSATGVPRWHDLLAPPAAQPRRRRLTSLESDFAFVDDVAGLRAGPLVQDLLHLAVDSTRHQLAVDHLTVRRYEDDRRRTQVVAQADESTAAGGRRPMSSASLPAVDLPSPWAAAIRVEGRLWGELVVERAGRPPEPEALEDAVDRLAGIIARAQDLGRLAESARLDPLTGVGNRRVLEEHLDRFFGETAPDTARLAVIIADLDGLKTINDTQGHDVGDDMIRIVAKALRRATEARPGAIVCRIGGDEFCVLLRDVDATTAQAVALEAVADAVDTDPHARVSCGVAVAGATTASPRDLLRAADRAQYRAKRDALGAAVHDRFLDDPENEAGPLPDESRSGRRTLRDRP